MEGPIPAPPLNAFMTLKSHPTSGSPSLNWNNYIQLYGALDRKVLSAKLVCMVGSRNHQKWQQPRW